MAAMDPLSVVIKFLIGRYGRRENRKIIEGKRDRKKLKAIALALTIILSLRISL
jgi:hypothetical protein